MSSSNNFFKDKKVAKSFEPVFGVDKHISLPGYSGMLSDINTEVAEALIRMGDNQVAKKTAAPTPPQELS